MDTEYRVPILRMIPHEDGYEVYRKGFLAGKRKNAKYTHGRDARVNPKFEAEAERYREGYTGGAAYKAGFDAGCDAPKEETPGSETVPETYADVYIPHTEEVMYRRGYEDGYSEAELFASNTAFWDGHKAGKSEETRAKSAPPGKVVVPHPFCVREENAATYRAAYKKAYNDAPRAWAEKDGFEAGYATHKKNRVWVPGLEIVPWEHVKEEQEEAYRNGFVSGYENGTRKKAFWDAQNKNPNGVFTEVVVPLNMSAASPTPIHAGKGCAGYAVFLCALMGAALFVSCTI